MKNSDNFLFTIVFLLMLFTSCDKDKTPELESQILFSVALDEQKFEDNYREAYIAAYTTDGDLINYGSLSDSTIWELKAEFEEDKIDILYFEIQHERILTIDHIKNVNIGQSFEDDERVVHRPSYDYRNFTLKVEDFGNYPGNSTSLNVFEMLPRNFIRGFAYSGEFDWERIEDAYAYKPSYCDLDPRYQGTEILIFERGTNLPYIYYLDIPATDINSGDTITLNKSDFKPGQLKTIQINSSKDEYSTLILYTYNTIFGKKDLITSHDLRALSPTDDKFLNYIVSDIVPINYWKLRYYTALLGSTSYTIQTNKAIPSSIDKEELTGHKITMGENQIEFTHSNILPGRNIARSNITFTKGNGRNIVYTVYFDANESIGTTTIIPFEIPGEIVMKYTDILESDTLEWNKYTYSQTYTNITNNSPLEFLRNSLLNWFDNNSSNHDYTFEEFKITL